MRKLMRARGESDTPDLWLIFIWKYIDTRAWNHGASRRTLLVVKTIAKTSMSSCALLITKLLVLCYTDVPEGAVIIREHTAMNNLFSCLWFNEVHLLTPRDQLSFGYVVDRLKGAFKVFMFQNCEYNSLFELHPHIREHSSKIEWVKSLQELKGKGESLKESRGGFGLWTPYPGDLDSVELPKVVRTSKAGWGSKHYTLVFNFCLIAVCGLDSIPNFPIY